MTRSSNKHYNNINDINLKVLVESKNIINMKKANMKLQRSDDEELIKNDESKY